MKSTGYIDPELKAFAEAFPRFDISDATLANVREHVDMLAQLEDPRPSGVERHEIQVPGLQADPKVRCLVYMQIKQQPNKPALLQIHGGGMVLSGPEISDSRNIAIASHLGITVVSVDYRLAPEHPFPAALDDCHAVWRWLTQSDNPLNIEQAKIGVSGDSAGGGLAASLCLRLRETSDTAPAFQQLIHPMLDDRTSAVSKDLDTSLGNFVWTNDNNRYGWAAYLGDTDPAIAVPARAAHYNNLPPTWICVGSLDLFLDENISLARNLIHAGVPAELQIYPGACHGFSMAKGTSLANRFESDYLQSLGRGLSVQ